MEATEETADVPEAEAAVETAEEAATPEVTAETPAE